MCLRVLWSAVIFSPVGLFIRVIDTFQFHFRMSAFGSAVFGSGSGSGLLSGGYFLSGHGEPQVAVPLLAGAIQRHYKKMQQYFFLPIYFIFALLLTIILLVHRVNWFTSRAEFYYETTSNAVLGAAAFEAVNNTDDLATWLLRLEEVGTLTLARTTRGVGERAAVANDDRMELLEMINVRQLRARPESCDSRQIGIIFPLAREIMRRKSCILSFSPTQASLTPFGPNATFIPSLRQPSSRRLSIMPRVAKFYDVTEQSIEFSAPVLLPRGGKLGVNASSASPSTTTMPPTTTTAGAPSAAPSSMSAMADLLKKNYIDDATRVVVVDVVGHFSVDDVYVATSFVFQRSTVGRVYTEAFSTVFYVIRVPLPFVALDFLLLLSVLFLFALTCVDIRETFLIQFHTSSVQLAKSSSLWRTTLNADQRRASDASSTSAAAVGQLPFAMRIRRLVYATTSILRFWELSTLLLLCITSYVVALRLQLWFVNPPPDDGSEQAIVSGYTWTVDYMSTFQSSYEMCCYSYMLVALRFVYCCQYLNGLNLIANTVRFGSQELMRVFFLSSFMMAGFGVAASVLYGTRIYKCRTLPQAIAFLVRSWISADVRFENYAAMQDAVGILNEVFMTCFFLLFWMLLLNLVVAIVSSAFAAGQRDRDQADSFLTVLRQYVTLSDACYTQDHHTSLHTWEAVSAALPAGEREKPLSNEVRAFLSRFRASNVERVSATQVLATAGISLKGSYRSRLQLLFSRRRQRVAAFIRLSAVAPDVQWSLSEFSACLGNIVGPADTWPMELFRDCWRSLMKQNQTTELAEKTHARNLSMLRSLRVTVCALQGVAIEAMVMKRSRSMRMPPPAAPTTTTRLGEQEESSRPGATLSSPDAAPLEPSTAPPVGHGLTMRHGSLRRAEPQPSDVSSSSSSTTDGSDVQGVEDAFSFGPSTSMVAQASRVIPARRRAGSRFPREREVALASVAKREAPRTLSESTIPQKEVPTAEQPAAPFVSLLDSVRARMLRGSATSEGTATSIRHSAGSFPPPQEEVGGAIDEDCSSAAGPPRLQPTASVPAEELDSSTLREMLKQHDVALGGLLRRHVAAAATNLPSAPPQREEESIAPPSSPPPPPSSSGLVGVPFSSGPARTEATDDILSALLAEGPPAGSIRPTPPSLRASLNLRQSAGATPPPQHPFQLGPPPPLSRATLPKAPVPSVRSSHPDEENDDNDDVVDAFTASLLSSSKRPNSLQSHHFSEADL